MSFASQLNEIRWITVKSSKSIGTDTKPKGIYSTPPDDMVAYGDGNS
jgi:hypothetical protein